MWLSCGDLFKICDECCSTIKIILYYYSNRNLIVQDCIEIFKLLENLNLFTDNICQIISIYAVDDY